MRKMKMIIMTRRMMESLLALDLISIHKLLQLSRPSKSQRGYNSSVLQSRDSLKIQDSMK
jgi:hypothetical protein